MSTVAQSNQYIPPVWLPQNPKRAIEFYRDVHSQTCDDETLKQAKRMLCRADLFYLMTHVLGRIDMVHPWLFDRCREVQANPDGFLDLWGREHGKSSIITFGMTIQDILTDPEITIGIFSHTRPIAKGFLRQIKQEFENNQELKSLFDDILYNDPHKQSPKWSEDDGITVIRKGNPKECTLEAYGLVDGMPTGKHYRLRIYDDVVTRESVTTPEQVKKTTDAWELSDNLGSIGGKVRTIGTRYSLYDTYQEMLRRKAVVPRIYAATANGRMDGKPVLFTQEEWERRKKVQTRKTIAAQLLQNPLADEDARFRPEWLRPYEIRPRTLNVSITCDPSRGRTAKSDNTAIAVIGYAQGGTKYLLDGYCHRMGLTQRWICLRDLYKKWSKEPGVQTISVGYERFGAQSDDEYFQERMRLEKFFFTMRELNWPREGGTSKEHRVDRLEPDFRNARFFLPNAIWREGKPMTWKVDDDPDSKTYQTIDWQDFNDLTRSQKGMVDAGSPDLIAKAIKRVDGEGQIYDLTNRFIEEYLSFPFGEHDDLIDTMSRIYDMEMLPPMIINHAMTDPPMFFDS